MSIKKVCYIILPRLIMLEKSGVVLCMLFSRNETLLEVKKKKCNIVPEVRRIWERERQLTVLLEETVF